MAASGEGAQAVDAVRVEQFLLELVDVLIETQRAEHHFVGRRLVHAARDVGIGIDAGDEAGRRRRQFQALAGGVGHDHPGVVQRKLGIVEVVAPFAHFAERHALPAIDDADPVAHAAAVLLHLHGDRQMRVGMCGGGRHHADGDVLDRFQRLEAGGAVDLVLLAGVIHRQRHFAVAAAGQVDDVARLVERGRRRAQVGRVVQRGERREHIAAAGLIVEFAGNRLRQRIGLFLRRGGQQRIQRSCRAGGGGDVADFPDHLAVLVALVDIQVEQTGVDGLHIGQVGAESGQRQHDIDAAGQAGGQRGGHREGGAGGVQEAMQLQQRTQIERRVEGGDAGRRL